jgi:hypothetical protein
VNTEPGANVIQLLFFVTYVWSKSARVFVLGKTFQPSPSIMFTVQYRNIPERGAPERGFPWVGYILTCKHWTRLERLARDKHSSLL